MGSIRVRILKEELVGRLAVDFAGYSGLDPSEDTESRQDRGSGGQKDGSYSGLEPSEDTERAKIGSAFSWMKGYSGLDPSEDTERVTRAGGGTEPRELQWARSE